MIHVPFQIRAILQAVGREAFRRLLMLAALISALLGVALYVTAWLVLLPQRLAAAPRGHGGEVQALQDCGAGPCAAPRVYTTPARHAQPKAKAA